MVFYSCCLHLIQREILWGSGLSHQTEDLVSLRMAGVWTGSKPGSCPRACDHDAPLRGPWQLVRSQQKNLEFSMLMRCLDRSLHTSGTHLEPSWFHPSPGFIVGWSLGTPEHGDHLFQFLVVSSGFWVYRNFRTTTPIPAPTVFTQRNTGWNPCLRLLLPSLSNMSAGIQQQGRNTELQNFLDEIWVSQDEQS